MAKESAEVCLDIGVADSGRVRYIGGAGYAQRRLAGYHPGWSLKESIARAELGIAEAGALGVRRRGDIDVLQSGIEDASQVVSEAVFDERSKLVLVAARRGHQAVAAFKVTGRRAGAERRQPLPGSGDRHGPGS